MSKERRCNPLARMLRELEQTLRTAGMRNPKLLRLAEQAARQAHGIEARMLPEYLP